MAIDFEKDQQDAMKKTENIQSLADQVEKLESLQSRLQLQEDNMKSTKKEIEKISGDIIHLLAVILLYSPVGLTPLKNIH